MRSHLEKTEDVDIIQYGCSAHILNLLAKDLEIPAVTASIVKVVKYFRNHHIPAALYKQAGGSPSRSTMEYDERRYSFISGQ